MSSSHHLTFDTLEELEGSNKRFKGHLCPERLKWQGFAKKEKQAKQAFLSLLVEQLQKEPGLLLLRQLTLLLGLPA